MSSEALLDLSIISDIKAFASMKDNKLNCVSNITSVYTVWLLLGKLTAGGVMK